MALKSPKSAFELYVEKHPDIKKAFEESGSTNKALFGSRHWKTHGRKEGGRYSPGSLRVDDEGRKTSSAFATAMKGISIEDYKAGRRPSWKASTQAWRDANPKDGSGGTTLLKSGKTDPNEWKTHYDTGQPAGSGSHLAGQSWAWTLRGELEDYKVRNSPTSTKRVLADVNGERGYLYLQNPEEKDKTKQRWQFRSKLEGREAARDSRVPWVSNITIYGKGKDGDKVEYAMDDRTTTPTTTKTKLPLKEETPPWESAFADLLSNLTNILNKPPTTTTMTETTPKYGLEDTHIVKRPLDDPSLKTSTLTMVNARAPVGGMSVVDPVTGTVYANPGAARAAGVTSWVYKYKWDALRSGASTFSAVA